MMNNYPKTALCIIPLFISSTLFAGEPVCSDSAAEVSVQVDTSKTIRAHAPTALFGFNVPWYDFQTSYYVNKKTYSDLVSLLQPFKGAAYRYPGGTPSNTFEWRKAIGKVETRPSMHHDFGQYAKPIFGVDEFIKFVKDVDGSALWTVNLAGPYKGVWSQQKIASEVVALINYISSPMQFGCIGGSGCRITALELGNELDFGSNSYTAEHYISLAEKVIAATSNMSEITWIANGRTAPWNINSGYRVYNRQLAEKLANKVKGIAIHPYYDGMDVPAVYNYVKQYGDTWRSYRSDGAMYITEHARWPDDNRFGAWSDNWYQTTSLGGAISVSDFILTSMPNPAVEMANMHALSAIGPWKFIRLDKNTATVYPSALYWGMRVLREAYLDDVVQSILIQPKEIKYSGGYALNVVAMSNGDDTEASLLGVNRNAKPYKLNIEWLASARSAGTSTFRWVTSGKLSDDNSDIAKTKVKIKTSTENIDSEHYVTSVCIPAYSVFSFVEQKI